MCKMGFKMFKDYSDFQALQISKYDSLFLRLGHLNFVESENDNSSPILKIIGVTIVQLVVFMLMKFVCDGDTAFGTMMRTVGSFFTDRIVGTEEETIRTTETGLPDLPPARSSAPDLLSGITQNLNLGEIVGGIRGVFDRLTTPAAPSEENAKKHVPKQGIPNFGSKST
jgi:hypothetical protein